METSANRSVEMERILLALPTWMKVGVTLGAVFFAGFGAYAGFQNLVGLPNQVVALQNEVRALRDEFGRVGGDADGLSVRLALSENALCEPYARDMAGEARDRYCEVVMFIKEYGIVPKGVRNIPGVPPALPGAPQ